MAEAKLKAYASSSRSSAPKRVYHCGLCDSHHLTSQELRP